MLIYEPTDIGVRTGDGAVGPWDPSLQHGAAPAALVARAAERQTAKRPMQVARMTIELMRPVPVAPLAIDASVVREGRKIQLLAVSLHAEGREVVRASVLRARGPEHGALAAATPPVPYGPPEESLPLEPGSSRSPFLEGVELRAAREQGVPGRHAIWYRLRRPIVAGEPTSGLMRAAATADFTNGTGSSLDAREWSFVNADLTVQLVRPPLGEWILLEAGMWLSRAGAAAAFGRLADESGFFGCTAQSLVVERRQPPAKE
jgi:hypothetical protein